MTALLPLVIGLTAGVLFGVAVRATARIHALLRTPLPAVDSLLSGPMPDASPALLYTRAAAFDKARHELNTELIEATIAYPAATGVDKSTPGVWYEREFGNTRIRVRAVHAFIGRPPMLTGIEVTRTLQRP